MLKAGITTIKYLDAKTGLVTEASCNTPFPQSAPSKPALEEAAFEALFKVNPQLVIPPYRKLMEEMRGEWGPVVKEGEEVGPGWSIIFTAPYTPTEGAIELKWADGKNYVGKPENYYVSR